MRQQQLSIQCNTNVDAIKIVRNFGQFSPKFLLLSRDEYVVCKNVCISISMRTRISKSSASLDQQFIPEICPRHHRHVWIQHQDEEEEESRRMIIRLGSSCTTCSLAAASSSPSSLCISAHTILLWLGSCILHLDSYIHMHLGMGTCTCMVQCTLCIWTLALASGYLDTSRGVCTSCSFNFTLCTWIHLQRSHQHQQHWQGWR